MSAKVKEINSFFRSANKSDIEKILAEVLLSERQHRIFSMYYIQRHDMGFIADSLCCSYSVIKTEAMRIRGKIGQSVFFQSLSSPK